MQKHQDILQQVGRMALATAGCSAIMLAIYAVVGRLPQRYCWVACWAL